MKIHNGRRQLGRHRYEWEENIETDGNTVLGFGLNSTVTRQGTDAGSCAHNTKPSYPVKGGGFIHCLSDNCVLRNAFAGSVNFS